MPHYDGHVTDGAATKTYWLSFCDDEGRSTGVCVVEVTAEEAADARDIAARLSPAGYPDGHEWIVAAVGQSLRMECNPGGSAQATEVDPEQLPPDLPRNRLLREDELKRNGWA